VTRLQPAIQQLTFWPTLYKQDHHNTLRELLWFKNNIYHTRVTRLTTKITITTPKITTTDDSSNC